MIRFAVYGFLAWIGCSASAQAYCQLTTESGVQAPGTPCVETGLPLAWRRACMTYSLDARNDELVGLSLEDLSAIAQRSFDAWTSVRCGGSPIPLGTFEGELSICRAAAFEPEGGNVSTIAFVPDWSTRSPALPRNAFATTFVWFDTDTGEILDADILLNPTLGPFADCPDDGCIADDEGTIPVDLRNVLTHEIGHFFGLGHSDDPAATMAPDAVRGDLEKRTLGSDDEAGICGLYESTTSTECSAVPSGGPDLDCEDGLPGVEYAKEGNGGCSVGAPGRDSRAGFVLLLGVAVLLSRRRARRNEAVT